MSCSTPQQRFYSAINLHARLLAICMVNQAGNLVLRQQLLRELLEVKKQTQVKTDI